MARIDLVPSSARYVVLGRLLSLDALSLREFGERSSGYAFA